MNENRRSSKNSDRRANPRGGRRRSDIRKPWYMRRRLWLAAATLLYVGWRRMRRLTQDTSTGGSVLAA